MLHVYERTAKDPGNLTKHFKNTGKEAENVTQRLEKCNRAKNIYEKNTAILFLGLTAVPSDS